MKAPKSAYAQINNILVVEVVRKSGTALYNYVARFLKGAADAGGYSTTDAGLAAAIKELFYLDHLMRIRRSGTVIGFIGGVNVGGANARYHNLTKRFAGLSNKAKSIKYLSDAGLNTLAHAEVRAVNYLFTNAVSVEVYVRSAFYEDTTVSGTVRMKYLNSSEYLTVGNLSPVRLAKRKEGTFSMEYVSDRSLALDSNSAARIYVNAVNSEGTMQGYLGKEPLPDLKVITLRKCDNQNSNPLESTGAEYTVGYFQEHYEEFKANFPATDGGATTAQADFFPSPSTHPYPFLRPGLWPSGLKTLYEFNLLADGSPKPQMVYPSEEDDYDVLPAGWYADVNNMAEGYYIGNNGFVERLWNPKWQAATKYGRIYANWTKTIDMGTGKGGQYTVKVQVSLMEAAAEDVHVQATLLLKNSSGSTVYTTNMVSVTVNSGKTFSSVYTMTGIITTSDVASAGWSSVAANPANYSLEGITTNQPIRVEIIPIG